MKTQAETLQDEYRQRFASSENYRKRVWQTLCRSFFERFIPAQATILDVGCGWGEFINNISCAKKFAIDLNADAMTRLNTDVTFLHQDCSSKWPVAAESLDFVFSSNFLEHLPNKQAIEATLHEAYLALKPGGQICLLGPNIRYVPGQYWDFWDHHIPLTDLSVSEILKLSGFKIMQNFDRFLPYTMSEGGQAPLFLVKAYLRMPFFWRFFGKQFLVIAKK